MVSAQLFNQNIFIILTALIAALITFWITFKISNFFIARREHWRQSQYSIIMLKLGMAAGAAFVAFLAVLGLFTINK